jgi:hypothetical protein
VKCKKCQCPYQQHLDTGCTAYVVPDPPSKHSFKGSLQCRPADPPATPVEVKAACPLHHLEGVYSSIADPLQRLKYIMHEHMLQTAPSLSALQTPVKERKLLTSSTPPYLEAVYLVT